MNITAANQGVCPASWIKNNRSNFCEVDKLNGNAFIFQHKKVISIRTKYIFCSVVKFTSFISNFRITRNTKITTTNWTVQLWSSFVMEQKQEQLEKKEQVALFLIIFFGGTVDNGTKKRFLSVSCALHISLNIDVCSVLCLRFITSRRFLNWYNCAPENITQTRTQPATTTTEKNCISHFAEHNSTLLLIIHRIHCCHQNNRDKKCRRATATDMLDQIDFHFLVSNNFSVSVIPFVYFMSGFECLYASVHRGRMHNANGNNENNSISFWKWYFYAFMVFRVFHDKNN